MGKRWKISKAQRNRLVLSKRVLENPPLIEENDYVWLKKLKNEPIQRDAGNGNMPYEVATRLLLCGLITPGTRRFEAIAQIALRVWKITDEGVRFLQSTTIHPETKEQP